MSFVGTGGEDWVELDLDLFEQSRAGLLDAILLDGDHSLAERLGSAYEVERTDNGEVFLVIDGRRRYRAEIGYDDRLLLTGILDPDGPL